MLDLLEALVIFVEQLLMFRIIEILGDQVHAVKPEVFGLDREELELLRVTWHNVRQIWGTENKNNVLRLKSDRFRAEIIIINVFFICVRQMWSGDIYNVW